MIPSKHGFYQTAPRFAVPNGDTINAGLTGMWMFSEGAGSKLSDISPFRRRANVVAYDGAMWVPSRTGRGLKLNGSTQYATTVDNISPNSTTASFSCLFRVAAFSINKPIFAQWNEGANTRSWALSIHSDNTLRFFSSANGTSTASDITGPALVADTWYHVVGVICPAAKYLFLNGKLTNTAAATTLFTTAQPIGFGYSPRFGAANDVKLTGTVAMFRTYRRRLFPAEIARLYARPLAGLHTPVIHLTTPGTPPVSGNAGSRSVFIVT